LLLVVGILAALAAAQLLAAAAGRHISPWTHPPLPQTSGGWAILLAVAAGLLLALIVLLLQRGDEIIAVSVSGAGSVLVPSAALERLVETVALRDRDVVQARARVQSQAGRLSPRLWVALRPFADAETIAADLAARMTATLSARTGLPLEEPVVRSRTVAVGQLRRYLS
jgi:hypothetical protein